MSERDSGDLPEARDEATGDQGVSAAVAQATGTHGEGAPEVIAERVRGTVKWFDVNFGCGCAVRHDTLQDIFLPQSEIYQRIPYRYRRSLQRGELVEFDVVQTLRGTRAAHITGPGGVPVQASRPAPSRHAAPESCQGPSGGQRGPDQGCWSRMRDHRIVPGGLRLPPLPRVPPVPPSPRLGLQNTYPGDDFTSRQDVSRSNDKI